MKIDYNLRQLTLLDNRFYMDEAGYVPSVTTILQAYPKGPEYYAWLKKNGEDADEVLKAAGTQGSNVHYLTEVYDAGHEVTLVQDGKLNYTMNEWAMFERYVDFTTRFDPLILMCEASFLSHRLGYAGTIDRVYTINGKRMLVDIKTSNAIYDQYWLQCASYRELYREHTEEDVDAVGILWLNAKTKTNGKGDAIQGAGWQLVMKSGKEVDDDLELFKHVKTLWEAQNKDIKPRNLTYQLSYVRPQI